jgi:uncharacterized protein
MMSHDANGRTGLLERQHWLTFLLPFLIFSLAGSLEPSPTAPGGEAIGLAIPYACYPWVYATKIVLTLVAIAFVWPGYRKFPLRLSRIAIVVGVVGGPLWIALSLLDCEHRFLLPLLEPMKLGWLVGAGARSAFNPFEQLAGQPALAWAFLAVRFFGLVAVIPLIEEFFLRGFVMRFVMERDWWKIPFGTASGLAIVVGTLLPMLSHPEKLAAAVWFSLITWLMLRTRNIWDCVAAHAITNLILGIYVVTRGGEAWQLL